MSIEDPTHRPCPSNEPKHAHSKNTTYHHIISSPIGPLSSYARNVLLAAAPQFAITSKTSKINPESLVPKINAAPDTQPLQLPKTPSKVIHTEPLSAIPEPIINTDQLIIFIILPRYGYRQK